MLVLIHADFALAVLKALLYGPAHSRRLAQFGQGHGFRSVRKSVFDLTVFQAS